MNHGKAECHAESVAGPVNVKQGGIIVPVSGEDRGKSNQLNENVSEEELEFAVQAAVDHKGGDSRLQHGMHDPERVIEDLNFLAHACVRLHRPSPHTLVHRRTFAERQGNVSRSQPDVQWTEVTASNVTVLGTTAQGYLRAMTSRRGTKAGGTGR